MEPGTTQHLAAEVARTAARRGLTVAVAESLTSGRLVSELGRAPDAATWLRGGVTAYATEVKQRVLGVSPGPVVTALCAEEMAAGAARVLESDVAVSTTGVGGPDPAEGHEPGTVFIGWSVGGRTGSELYTFDADPAGVVQASVSAALRDLLQAMEGAR